MNKLVNVLVIEDVEDDARSVMESLRSGGFDVTHRCVRGAAEFDSALANEHWDAVIAELDMPGFPGLEALKVFLAADLDIPFMLMSNTFVEDIAVAGIKAGASDYITRDRLARLAPVMARELEETRSRASLRKARRDLIDSEERFRSLTALSSDWYWEQDEQLRFTYVSAGLRDKYSEALESWAGKTRWELPYRDADWANHRATVEARMPFYEVELQPFRHDGSNVYVSVSGEPKLNAQGRFLGYRGVGRDITEHVRDKIECKESEGKIRRLNRLYAMVSATNSLVMRVRERDELFRKSCQIAVEHGEFEMAWIGVVDHGETRIVPMASAGGDERTMATIKDLFLTNEGTLQGRTLAARAIREKAAVVSNDVENDDSLLFGKMHAESGMRSIAMLPLIVADNAIGVYVLYTRKLEFFDAAGLMLLTELAGNVAFAIDHIEKQERLDHFAYYDALTGLANRRLFLDRLTQHMLRAATGGHQLALFLIDLERFKKINDSLGRPTGDALLKLVATWLTDNLGDVNALARVDADHFAAVLPVVTHEADVVRLLERTIGAFLNHSFWLDGVAYRIAAKVGVALFPGDGADADTLFKNAEAAVKKAKVAGDRYLFYADKMTETVAGSLGLENRLRQALERDEYVLHYQAKVNIASGELTGAEALIRWNDPQTGLVPPGRFIPILEETGLIQEVGRWALGKALEDYQRWRRKGLPAVRIAVNVSPLQLRSRSFVTEIERAIGEAPDTACGLELELTESVIMENVAHNIVSLSAIRALGITIAIDDFGTGFSSLSYLSKLPLDTLKIDRSFVTDMVARAEGRTLVGVIINLAHALKLKVVAEGVETEEQLRELKLLGCDEMQGFLFGKPMPAALFEKKYLSRSAGERASSPPHNRRKFGKRN